MEMGVQQMLYGQVLAVNIVFDFFPFTFCRTAAIDDDSFFGVVMNQVAVYAKWVDYECLDVHELLLVDYCNVYNLLCREIILFEEIAQFPCGCDISH